MKQHLLLAVGVVSVAFAAVFIRLAEAPPLVIAVYRLGLAALAVAPVAILKSGQELRRLGVRQVLLCAASGVFLALHFGLWITSLRHTSVASSVVLVTASPIFAAVASRFLFHERLTARLMVGIGVSITGAVVIGYGSRETGTETLLGNGLALGGAVAISGYLLIGRNLRNSVGFWSYISLSYTSAAMALLAVVLISGLPLTGYSGQTYLLLGLLALVPQLLGHSSLNWAVRHLPATLVTIAVLGEPVGATLLAFLLLGEAPAAAEIAGGLLVLSGIALAFYRGQQPASDVPPPRGGR